MTPNLRSTPLLSFPVNDVLPSNTDESNINHNFALIVSRRLVDHLKYFKQNYYDVVDRHNIIKHDLFLITDTRRCSIEG